MAADPFQKYYEIDSGKGPKVNIQIIGETMPSLLDSGTVIRLLHQNKFNHYFIPSLGLVEGLEAEVHNFLDLKGTNERRIPLFRYIEEDIQFLD